MPRGTSVGSKATQFKPLTEPLATRFHKSYIPEPNSGCWLWLESCDTKGYARIRRDTNGGLQLAHRVSWELAHQQKTRLFILHHCDNPSCVNPDHLYAGTQKDNMRDRSARGRGNWPKGEQNPRAKLTNEKVALIRADARSQSKIAKDFGVSQTLIWAVKNNKKWSGV